MTRVAAPPFSKDRRVHLWILIKSVSDAGDALWKIALAWTAVQMASPTIAGILLAANTVPRALFLLVGGVVADRYEPRWVMILANLVRVAVLSATVVWIISVGPSLVGLFVAVIVFGVADALYEPAGTTIGRQLVRGADLSTYASLLQTGHRLGTMGGSAIGGFLVAKTGIEGSATVNGLTFAVVVLFLAIWLRPRYPLERATTEPIFSSIQSGFVHLRRTPQTRTLVLALSGLNLAIAPALGLGVPLLALEAEWGASTVGVLQALVGVGATTGALLLIRWRPKYATRWAFCGLIVQGLAISALGVGPLWVAGASCAVIGFTSGVSAVLLGAVFVAFVDEEFLGRMVSIQRLGDDTLMPLMMVLFGVFASSISVMAALAVFGFAMAGLMILPLFNPAVRQIILPAR